MASTRTTTRKTEEPEHPILDAGQVSSDSSRRLLKEISFCVPWEDYSSLVSVETFDRIKLVAMFDLWASAPHEDVLGKAGITKREATAIRKEKIYEMIHLGLQEAMLMASKQFTDDQWIERGRQAAWRRIFSDTAFGPDKERALSAARDFTDRSSPKATRAELGGGERVIFLPEAMIELLGKAMGEAKQLKAEVVDVSPERESTD